MDEKKLRILMAENDEVDQMALRRFMEEEKLPYHYVISGSVKDAREKLAKEQFDVLILDYMLDDGTAFDLFDAAGDAAIIIATGSGDEEVAVKAMKMGAYDYIIKDMDQNYLKIIAVTIEKAIQRSKAEKEIRMLSHAIMNISDSVYITDMNDRIIFVNKAFCQTYGYSEEEILGRDSGILQEGESLDHQKGSAPSHHRNKSGKTFPISLSRSVISDVNGKDMAKVSVVRDVTEILQAEYTRLMALFAELNPAPMLRFDKDGRIIMGNQAAMEIFSSSSLVGESVIKLLPGLSKFKPADLIERGDTRIHSEVIGTRFFDIIIRWVPELGIGHVYGNDITERKRLEEQVIIQERLATIGQTVAGMAHCMKNIFTSINGGISLLDKSMKTDDSEIMHRALLLLQRSSKRLYFIVMNMLDYSKKPQPIKERLMIREIFEEVKRTLENEAEKRNCQIEYQVNPMAEIICLDTQMLFRILINLAYNALDAMPNGGKLSISSFFQGVTELGLKESEIPFLQEGKPLNAFVIEVSDTGTGISQEDMTRIFEPFYSTKGGKGSGLGLPTVKQLVEGQDGIIRIISETDKGTTFRLIFF